MHRCDFLEPIRNIQEGGCDVRIEMRASAFLDDPCCGFVGKGRLVYPLADQGVIDVRERHEPCRQGYFVRAQSSRVSRAVPFFMMAPGNLPGVVQEGGGRIEELFTSMYRVAAEGGVSLHDLELLGTQFPGLQQDAIGNTHLADIVKRRGFPKEIYRVVREISLEPGMVPDPFAEDTHVELGPPDVIPRFIVSGLGEGAHGHHRHILDGPDFPRPADDLILEEIPPAPDEIAGLLCMKVRPDPRQHDGRTGRFCNVIHRA